MILTAAMLIPGKNKFRASLTAALLPVNLTVQTYQKMQTMQTILAVRSIRGLMQEWTIR
jgi:hypothetical protein